MTLIPLLLFACFPASVLPAQAEYVLLSAAPEGVRGRAEPRALEAPPDRRPTTADAQSENPREDSRALDSAEDAPSFFRRAVRFFGGGEAERRLQGPADDSYGMRRPNYDGDDWQYGDDWVTLVDDEPSSLDTDDDDWVTGVDDLFGGFGGADDFFGDGGFGFLDDANYDADCAEYGDECSFLDCCGGESCFQKNDDFAYCLETCPAQADWACYVPPCAGKGERCDDETDCCGSDSCFWKVDEDVGECFKSCPDTEDFECYEPPCAEDGDACGSDDDCCSGKHGCFQKTASRAECKRGCPNDPAWACYVPPPVEVPATPRPTPTPRTPRPTNPRPTPRPSRRPTPGPTARPTPRPTNPRPTPRPSPRPTRRPTPGPTARPTPRPTQQPVTVGDPTPRPIAETPRPTPRPTKRPSPQPTKRPSPQPTRRPTPEPTPRPTAAADEIVNDPRPTSEFVAAPDPTRRPSPRPTRRPSPSPTRNPTPRPTRRPTPRPSAARGDPTPRPVAQTPEPTQRPSPRPTRRPSPRPTRGPTRRPTPRPVAAGEPTTAPTERRCAPGLRAARGAECPPDLDLVACDAPGLAPGDLCEGDGECGTDTGLDNCDDARHTGADIYVVGGAADPTEAARPPTPRPTGAPTRRQAADDVAVVSAAVVLDGVAADDFNGDAAAIAAFKAAVAATVDGVASADAVTDVVARSLRRRLRRRLEDRATSEVTFNVAAADGADLRALEDGAFERELRSSGATLLEEATVREVDVGEREAAAPEADEPPPPSSSSGGGGGGGGDLAPIIGGAAAVAAAGALAIAAFFMRRRRKFRAAAAEPAAAADAPVARGDAVDVEAAREERALAAYAEASNSDAETREERALAAYAEASNSDADSEGAAGSSEDSETRRTLEPRNEGGGSEDSDARRTLESRDRSEGSTADVGRRLSFEERRARSAVVGDGDGSSEPDRDSDWRDLRFKLEGGGEPLEASKTAATRLGRRFAWDDDADGAGPGAVTWSGAGRFVRRFDGGTLELVDAREGFAVAAVGDDDRAALQASGSWPLERRVAALRAKLETLRSPWQKGRVMPTVRRESLLADCYAKLRKLTDAQWRWPFFFTIAGEKGLDAGGVGREVFRLATSQVFATEFGLFRTADGGADLTYTVQDDATVGQADRGPQWLTFAGKLVGKALLDGAHLDAHLNRCLLKHVCGEPLSLADLEWLDAPLWNSLRQLGAMDVSDLALTFSVDGGALGAVATRELVRGGADVAVTEANKDEFVALRLKDALVETSKRSVAAFLAGVYAVVPPEALLLVTAAELELMLCGTRELDVDEWRRHTTYKGAFAKAGEAHDVVRWFWEAVAAYAPERRAKLLQWCTGHGRVPVQGFSHLMGRDGVLRPFTLTSIALDQACFPRAHTCFNRIDIPLFAARDELRRAFDLVLDLGDQSFSMD